MSMKALAVPVVAALFALAGNLYAGPSLDSFGSSKTASTTETATAAASSEHAANSSLHYGTSWWHHAPSVIHFESSQTPTMAVVSTYY